MSSSARLPMRTALQIGLVTASLLVVSGVVSPALSQTPSRRHSPPLTEAAPESVGLSSARLARIDQMCQDAVDRGSIPGVVALVARHGRIAYHKSFGFADFTERRPMKRDDLFRIASQSKAITSTAVLMLWEEGKFQLDDPVSRYIPEFKNPMVLKADAKPGDDTAVEPAKSEITIRQLLTHTSGLGYGVIDNDERMKALYQKAGIVDLFTTNRVTIGENIRKLAKLPLHHHPGTQYKYCEGLDVLGYLIEVVSGMPFDVFLRRRLFEPIGMNDTWFYLPDEKASRLVPVQKPEGGAWVRYPVTFYDPNYPVAGAKAFFSGGAGLTSSARDYATFLQMYLNGGELNGWRILSRTTVQTALANQTGDLMSGGRKGDSVHGLAFGVLTEQGQNKGGRGATGTFDWGGYFNTQYFADPTEKIIGVLMKQTQGTTSDLTGGLFRQLVMQSIDD